MKITRLIIHKLIMFRFTGIETLDITFEELVQIIISPNGHGKTSLLKECNLRPSVKTNYYEDGYRKIYATDDHGEDYILTSDYKKKTSPHSFYKISTDEELNESGNTSIQEELVEQYFGYSKNVHDLCYLNYKVSGMAPGNLKTFLMIINPCNLKFIFDYYKKVTGQIRSCQNNLSSLYSRKNALEQQLLSEEIYNSLIEENKQLVNDIPNQITTIARLESKIDEYIKEKNNINIGTIDLNSLNKRLLSYRKWFSEFKQFINVDINILETDTNMNINKLTTQKETLEQDLMELVKDYEQCQTYIKEHEDTTLIIDTEDKLVYLKGRFDLLKNYKTIENPISEDLLEFTQDHIDILENHLQYFIEYKGPLFTNVDILRYKQKLDKWSLKSASYSSKLIQCLEKENYLKERMQRYEIGIPQDCKLSGCQLFKMYMTSYDEYKVQDDKNIKDMHIFNHRLNRLKNYLVHLNIKIRNMEIVFENIKSVMNYLNEYRYLRTTIQDVNIKEVLNTNPLIITSKIYNHFLNSKHYYEFKKIEKEYNETLDLKLKIEQSKSISIEFMEKLSIEKSMKIQENKNIFFKLNTEISNKKEELLLIQKYKEIMNFIETSKDLIKTYERNTTLEFEILLNKKLLEFEIERKNNNVQRLGEISSIISKQENINARYSEEILVSISKIEERKALYIEFEKILSPNMGIPHEYTVDFINGVLENANFFIQYISAYPLEFKVIDMNDPLDYVLYINIGDQDEPNEIGNCSDGQKAILDLCFILGLAVKLELSTFPLYLDEIDRPLDVYHKQKLLTLLNTIIDEHIVGQLFMINHHAIVSDGISNSNVIVLNDTNILVPEVYNEHVKIDRL